MNELLQKAKDGDQAALTEVILSSRPWVRFYSWRHFRPGVYADDLRQEAFIGVWQAIKGYDPSRGATFRTYAILKIRSALKNAARRKANHIPPEVMVSWEEQYGPVVGGKPSNPEIDELRACLDTLTARPKTIVARRYGIGCEEASLQEVAEDLGISRQRAHQILLKALDKIRSKMRRRLAARAGQN